MPKIPFIKRSGINSRVIIALFIFKIAAGIAIGWASLHLYGSGNDYWDINREGWKEYQLLLSKPKEYFNNIFSSGYAEGYAGVFDSFHSFWNDLRNNVVIKLVSIFNIFSRGDYYINSLFFNFIVFFGHIALYRIFIKIYEAKQRAIIVGCFLLPSMIYFTSGIHKDGLVFLMLSLLFYTIFEGIRLKKWSWRRILLSLFCLFILFLVRNFVMIALIPALLAWLIAAKLKRPLWMIFGTVYLLAGILLFNFHHITSFDPLATIVQKQTDFLKLPNTATKLVLNNLETSFVNFASNAPQALNHLLLRPYIWEIPVISILPFAIEVLGYQFLFIVFLLFKKKSKNCQHNPFIYFLIFFTLTAFLFIGYIVPNLGALVRYRSLYLPFIITPMICSIDWQKFLVKLKIKK